MKALVTAFDPFGGERINASQEAVSRLPTHIGKLEFVTAILPTTYARSRAALQGIVCGITELLQTVTGRGANCDKKPRENQDSFQNLRIGRPTRVAHARVTLRSSA